MGPDRSKWNQMSDKQKIDALYEYCLILEQTLLMRGQEIHGLYQRVDRLEPRGGPAGTSA